MCLVRVNILYTAMRTHATYGNRLEITLPLYYVYMHLQTPGCEIYVYKKSTHTDNCTQLYAIDQHITGLL
jgi:hypothetical protein